MSYTIAIAADEVTAPALDEAAISALVETALQLAGAVEGAEVSVVLSDDATVRQLNRDYRGVDAPTDVLSFGLSDLAQPAGDDEPDADGFVLPPAEAEGLLLGEVIVSHETALRQASEHDRTPAHELAHLIVHGVLHLLGHDHAEQEEERTMRAAEDAALTACGFPPGSAGWTNAPH